MSETTALVERIAAESIRVVDFRFTDLVGHWRHLAKDAGAVDAACLRDGLLIDGSAVPGWRDVTEADLLLKPVPGTAFQDPFSAQPTLVVLCDGAEPGTGIGYERDPRSAAVRAEAHLKGLRYADRVQVAVELSYFLFDEARPELGSGQQLTPRRPHDTPPRPRTAPLSAYLATPPADPMADIRAEIATVLAGLGLAGLRYGHGRAAGQNDLQLGLDGLVATADRVQLARYTIHQVAASYGKQATFLPKPLADEPGSAMAVQQSLWQGDRPIFAGQGYADLSGPCLQFIAGIIAHAKALNAFTNPGTNSYRRLRQGLDEPTLLAYAAHNRSAAIRIPYAEQAHDKRIEIRFPDPTANPYLALTALLMAGLDGIERKLEPGEAMDRNLYDLRPDDGLDLAQVAGSLDEALTALEADHDFLTQGEVVPVDLVEAYVQVKRRELDLVDRAPHPVEFQLYRHF